MMTLLLDGDELKKKTALGVTTQQQQAVAYYTIYRNKG